MFIMNTPENSSNPRREEDWLKQIEIVKMFVVRYFDDEDRLYHRESLSGNVARRTAQDLARMGFRPIVHRVDMPWDEVDRWLEKNMPKNWIPKYSRKKRTDNPNQNQERGA